MEYILSYSRFTLQVHVCQQAIVPAEDGDHANAGDANQCKTILLTLAVSIVRIVLQFHWQVQVCQRAIVPELQTAMPPTLETPINDTEAYIGYLDRLQANVATQVACSL